MLLDTLYISFFRPADLRHPTQAATLIGGLVVLALSLNAAGAVSLGVKGVIAFAIMFLVAGVLGVFWLAAAVQLVAPFWGGQGTSRTTLEAIARGLWPLLLSGPAIATANWSPTLGALFSLTLSLGTFLSLTSSIRYAHHLGWATAALCLTLTLGLSLLALVGLILWPLMLVLGT